MRHKIQKINIDEKELKKRRRELIIMLIIGILVIVFTLMASYFFNHEEPSLSSNIFIYALTSVNFILIVLLLFLIIRNLVKVFYEHRRGVIGSKLRTKLVATFVGLSLIPTILLFLFAINFLSYSMEFWFNIKIGDALKQALEVAQVYYQQMEEQAKFNARQISADITKNRLYDRERLEYLKSLVHQRQKNYKTGKIEIYFDFQKDPLIFEDEANQEMGSIDLTPKMKEEIYLGREQSLVQPTAKGDVIVGLVPVFSYAVPTEVIGRIAVHYLIPRGFVDKLTRISEASAQYGKIELLKNPIKLNYAVTLSIVTLVIIFLATWFGLTLAKEITSPIQNLVEATNRITMGDLDSRIHIEADDEIGVLVKSFNQMTSDLKKSKNSLEEANIHLEERRKYMETVLRNVSAGVVSVDKSGMITTVNRAAEEMLEINAERVLYCNYRDLMLPEHIALVDEFLQEMSENHESFLQKQLEIVLKDKTITVLVTMTSIKDEEQKDSGLVVVFEDVTQIQKAERAAAWREVARRMAHEIKNPLTPIQLSAQRLQKKYEDKLGEDVSVFKECTQTIIDQVEVLKNLVNEFSRYARMPVTSPSPNDLNKVVADAVALFQDAHRDIVFDFHPAEDLPVFELDAEQINRVMINLLDNAVAAMTRQDGRIEVVVRYDAQHRRAIVSVADNGMGVPAAYKRKIFEPYFSMKKSGTGLGLAIVTSIISDHRGQVLIADNAPAGTVVSFQLPVTLV